MAAPMQASRGMRVNAAARMLGAPKVVGQRQQPSSGAPGGRPRQVAPSRPVVQHQAHNQAPRQQIHQPAPRAAAHPAARPAARPAPAFNPLAGNLTSGQLAQLAGSITKANAEPLINAQRQQGQEIQGAEGTALQRQAGVGATEQQQLQGLQTGQEASAKTAQNNAAEAAMKAANEVQSTGQSVGNQTAGFVDPAVRAALSQSAATAGSLGGAAGQYAGAMGVSGANLMSGLRGAAATRMGEGATRLQQDYGAAQQRAQGEENKLLAKQPADARSLAVELGQKQFTDAATQASLGVKQGQLGVNAQKASTEKSYKQGQISVAAQKNANTLTLGQQKNAVTLKGDEIKARTDLEKQGLSNAGALAREQVKAKTSLEAANKKAGRLTTAQEDKLMGELSNAFQEVKLGRSTLGPKESNQQIREALTSGKRGKEKVPQIKNQTLITAAIEAWDYHKVSATTLQQLRTLGIQVTPKVQNGTLVFG